MDWVEPDYASEMEIFVRSDNVCHYVLLADGDNIVEDVLVKILGSDRAGRRPEPRLYFNDLELEKQKTLADYDIKLGSVLHLKCLPRVAAYADDPTELAKMSCVESGSPVSANGNGEMKILVQSKFHGNYALEVASSNTIRDVLVTVLPTRPLWASPKPDLCFNGNPLEWDKSLADYNIQDGFILHLDCPTRMQRLANQSERPNKLSGRKEIMLTDKPSAIWERNYDKVLLGLLVEKVRNEGQEILYSGKNFWRDIAAKFNESTGLKYEYKHLNEHFNFYRREYQIVNDIKHHPKFSWDHQRQIVIATDAEWNEYVKNKREARPYRIKAVSYIDLLEIMFADGENQ